MNTLKNKQILITGGTGSLGQWLVKTILANTQPARLVVFSRDELKQYEMSQTWSTTRYPCMRYFLGDIRDRDRLLRAFNGIDVVIHAAALKQVPAIEYNPLDGVKTNIQGTQNVIDAAIDCNVERVVCISTDKAVQPVNLYGATKLCAEKLTVSADAYTGGSCRTRFAVVRYGNVMGSRGSLLSLIAQKRAEGVIPLTDERMTRFLIHLDDVMATIQFALEHMQGGETFIPKIRSYFIRDVISAVAPECRIQLIGIRPGEKIHEALIAPYEEERTRDAGSYFVIKPLYNYSRRDHGWLDACPAFPAETHYESNLAPFLASTQETLASMRRYYPMEELATMSVYGKALV